MKHLYPTPKLNNIFSINLVRLIAAIVLLVAGFSVAVNAQTSTTELVFKSPVLVTGTTGADGAVYRFPLVVTGVDAMVKINGRSSNSVSLISLDTKTTGYNNAFQPQLGFNHNYSGVSDNWMEFQISFVQTNTSVPVVVNSFDVTGLGINGNNSNLAEYISSYALKNYSLEKNTLLTASDVFETIAGNNVKTGKRFDGPVTGSQIFDTTNKTCMVTCTYVNCNTLKVRAGAKGLGGSCSANRIYSYWFKGFGFQAPVTGTLPVSLIDWNAIYVNSNVSLKWTTTSEKNASHFIIERSYDASEYTDAAMIFAVGNSDIANNYSFTDKLPASNTGVIYYRLKMVDMDGKSTVSTTRIVRIGKVAAQVKVTAYPNPVQSELRVTIPQNWQDKQVSYQLMNANGQVIKSYSVAHANQTEVISMTQVPTGMYVIKVNSGNETGTQTIVKSSN